MVLKFDPKELDEQYNLDKESIVRNWFFVGAELTKLKRGIISTKIFGQKIQTTGFAILTASERSHAIWMYGNWQSILSWVESTSGEKPDDAFFQIASLNASHPQHIRREVTKWQDSKSK